MFARHKTKEIFVGNVGIGGDYPISIQSMTNTYTQDIPQTIQQIKQLAAAGCDIVRLAVPDKEAAIALADIKKEVKVPLIADIHFDYKLAIASLEAGIDGLRLNPGNIGNYQRVLKVVEAAKPKKIPIRIGVNSGSLSKQMIEKHGVTPTALVESALQHVAILEKAGYYQVKISVKASSVPFTLKAYRLLSQKVDYPLHLGVTEAGTEFSGTIKSAVGIGTLLAEGIGDTIRVSLTANPVKEVLVAQHILCDLGLRQGLEVISCPTCGRTEIDVIGIAAEVEKKLQKYADKNLKVAVMGCVVNGPGEAKEADFGIAGGKHQGIIFKEGKIIKTVQEDKLIESLLKIIEDHFDES
ncbi:MAG: flavodoxin-dependent (E)-4-hydroxy-3-methylbut-2-enyl-diphosphate synthase [Candidatus Cloacimonadota bacterium]|nr:flavodoxin-dependent (E)-4-hydroxy-3-methylbut-2-enyl-diphosphate synthase [Candidatus Cloacimonadota bacterium]